MPRFLSVSSSRADVGILDPVWRALSAAPDCELHVLLTGMHQARGATGVALPPGVLRHVGGVDLGGTSNMAAATGMLACAQAAADLFSRIEFDCLVLMGDRLDMFPAGCVSLPFNVAIAHIHGGELSHGAIDDRIRHAISKFAHLHFVSNVESANRLARMGEERWRIHVTGAPGLDTLRDAPVMGIAEFKKAVGLTFDGSFALMTVHPETNGESPTAPMVAALAAIDEVGMPALITAPNSDPEGARLLGMIEEFLPQHPRAVYRATLGSELYPNALRHAGAMVGNSSSGVIEAGLFGLPVINIGDRQAGRLSGPNVRHVSSNQAAVASELRSILEKGERYAPLTPYGDGNSAKRIAAVLTDLPNKRRLLYKTFNDQDLPTAFVAPWESSLAA